MLHDLLRSGQLQAAVSWVLREHRDNHDRYGELFEPLRRHGPASDARETAEYLAMYLLIAGDHVGARLAFSLTFPEAGTSKLIRTAHVVARAYDCFQFEPLAEECQRRFALEPLIVTWSKSAQASAERHRTPPCMARLGRGSVFGLSYIPVTEDGRTCFSGFTHNPDNPRNIRNSETVSTIPALSSNAIMGCFDGSDQYDDGVLIGNHENFGHWLLNHLARLALVESAPGLKGMPLVVGSNISQTQIECLERFGYQNSDLIRLRKGYLARFNMLWAPMMPFCSSSGLLYWSPHIIDFLRTRLGVRPPSSSRSRRRLYVSRRSSRWRRVLNENEIVKSLAKWGFEVIDPGGLTLAEQIELAGNAEVIMGAIGAGMTLLIFAPSDATIIELKSHEIIMDINPALCRQIGQRYVPLAVTAVTSGQDQLHFDVIVASKAVEEALDSIGLTH